MLGPAGLQARNRNLVGGDVGGGSYRLDQVIFRPVPSLSPYRTPLRGLYLGERDVPGRGGARRARRRRRQRGAGGRKRVAARAARAEAGPLCSSTGPAVALAAEVGG